MFYYWTLQIYHLLFVGPSYVLSLTLAINRKVSFGCLQSINESFDYINASSVFINETFIYKNGTCIYSLNQVRNKFSINEKELIY